jgi:multicomponent Na+:H+ antiporter subunit D
LGLLQLAWFGWIGAAFSNDVFSLFAFLELGWLAACGLAALGLERDRAAAPAAFRQLLWCGAAGVAFASGAALVQHAAGSSDLAEIGNATGAGDRASAAGFALMIAALATWALAAPLHAWGGALFGRAARLASLAIASVGVAAALTALARISLAAAISETSLSRGVSVGLAALGALSLAMGSLQAVGARDLRRLVCYASAAQAGAIMIALALGEPAGHAAAFMNIASQTLIALGLLGGAAMLEGRAPLAVLDGFGRRAPVAGAAIAVAALGLIGAPLTLGFWSRWRLIEAALASGWWWAAAMSIGASLAAVFYAGRLLERLYARAEEATAQRTWRVSLAPAHLVAIVAAIAFGFNAQPLWRAAGLAGELLAGIGR